MQQPVTPQRNAFGSRQGIDDSFTTKVVALCLPPDAGEPRHATASHPRNVTPSGAGGVRF